MQFESPGAQIVLGSVIMMPQNGSFIGCFGRPMNSYAILRRQGSVLVDSPFSWTMDAIEDLIGLDCSPLAMVLTHNHVAAAGDAFYEIAEHYEVPFLIHTDDHHDKRTRHLTVKVRDLTQGANAALLQDCKIAVIHLPGHSPGSVMLYTADDGGVLLAGDGAVGAAADDPATAPRLRRPLGADHDPLFLETWRSVIETLPIAAVAPLHGAFCLRSELGDAAFDAALANIVEGEPLDAKAEPPSTKKWPR